MHYLISIAVVLTISFIMGVVFGASASDVDPMEQERDDRDQMEYLRRWREKRKRS